MLFRLCALFIPLFFFVVPAPAEDALILAVHPYLPLAEIERRFDPLAAYLAQKIGRPVRVRIGTNYKDHVDHIGQNKVDIAFMGPAPYVKLVDAYGLKPILARIFVNDKPYFQGKIVVRTDSDLHKLAYLKNRSFAFGDPDSTMSHFVPRYMLLEAGVSVKDLARFDFLGSHHNVAMAVLSGDYDAGAMKEEVFDEFAAQGLRVLVSTPRIFEHLFVARSDLAPEIVQALREALYSLKDSAEGQKIMQGIQKDITAMAPADDHDYDNLRHILETIQGNGIVQ